MERRTKYIYRPEPEGILKLKVSQDGRTYIRFLDSDLRPRIGRMCFFRALKHVTWIKNILQSCQPQRLDGRNPLARSIRRIRETLNTGNAGSRRKGGRKKARTLSPLPGSLISLSRAVSLWNFARGIFAMEIFRLQIFRLLLLSNVIPSYKIMDYLVSPLGFLLFNHCVVKYLKILRKKKKIKD